jgi:NAD(P)H-dependent flavin oxidoreductase YrpB (nitropropane dioxygenase family)
MAAEERIAGTIASVGLVPRNCPGATYEIECSHGLYREIGVARQISPKGIIGVNIMVALTNYEELVKTAIEDDIDYIISGAGLPLALPKLVGERGKDIALIPIVSSARAADLICKRWWRDGHLPNAIIVEGAAAGGHLGVARAEVDTWGMQTLEAVCKEVLQIAKEWEFSTDIHIPVIAAGGIWDGKDIVQMFNAGCEGVQMATRFMATSECPLDGSWKQCLVNSKPEDMLLIDSPVGLPGRTLGGRFAREILAGEHKPINCPYHCLKTCDPNKAQFCIADALIAARHGDHKNGFVMAGKNAYRINEIVPIRKLVRQLVQEAETAL